VQELLEKGIASGKLGPKRQQGDMQIPEGFYHISGFNPASNFYLSLRINYPNPSGALGKGHGEKRASLQANV